MTRYNPQNLNAWWSSMQATDRREWIRISAEMGEFLQTLSGRDDLIAVVEPGSAHGALAVYEPEKAHVAIDSDRCAKGVDPADIHVSTEVGRLKHPAFVGAGVHEGSHAMSSHWPLDQRRERRAVVQAALGLEESRCELHMVRKFPEKRMFLRAAFAELVRSEDTVESVHQAASLAALGMARVDAGILDASEMAPVRDEIVAVLGEELYDGLREIWLEAHKVENTDQAAMEALGQRWVDLLPKDESGDEEGGIVIVCGHASDGEESEGTGSGAVAAVAEAIAEDAEAEAAEAVGSAKARDAAKERSSEASEVAKAERMAAKVFGHHSGGSGNEHVNAPTPPSTSTRATANRLARAIERAQHRERTKTVVSSAAPPGRLKGGEAMRRSAQRSMGVTVTAEPWRHVQRKHVENPPIVCGIMCDISGSMRWAEQPVADAAWAISHAVHRNEGTTATVAYGNRVHSVVKPGEASRMQRTFNARGGTEDFIGGLAALDGGLGLSTGTGVRMLVVVSDGHYTPEQRAGAERGLKRMVARGVKVLWICVDAGTSYGNSPVEGKGIEVATITNPNDFGTVVGNAITKALSAA